MMCIFTNTRTHTHKADKTSSCIPGSQWRDWRKFIEMRRGMWLQVELQLHSLWQCLGVTAHTNSTHFYGTVINSCCYCCYCSHTLTIVTIIKLWSYNLEFIINVLLQNLKVIKLWILPCFLSGECWPIFASFLGIRVPYVLHSIILAFTIDYHLTNLTNCASKQFKIFDS